MLRLAGRFCATERGVEATLATRPAVELAEVERRLGVTRDLIARRALRPPVVLGGLDDGAPLLPRLGAAGRALPPEELLDLFSLVERSEAARVAVPVENLELPFLADLLKPLPDLAALLSERSVIFDPDGRIKDTASARLAAIRGAIVRLRREVVRRLEEFVRSRPEALGETYVTEKQGRYCLPVKSDRRDAVAGIVHEKSGSGQTLFIEPLAVVEANNALAEALEEEREEVHRILVALTARFSAQRAELGRSVGVLTELDAAQARAEFSSRVDGVFPTFGDRLVLKGARHPLLDRRLAALRAEVFGEDAEERHSDAVPLDIELPEGKRALLLSGPNAGGKTVALKTVGLFSLLAQSGFAVPARAGTELPIVDRVLIVAGDAQDLLEDLSSFAASMVRTARVLAQATARSLLLFDELGSGTDPDEGAAIAIAVLEEDRRIRGGEAGAVAGHGMTVATTHLQAVKEWAHGQPDVLSAAMEFDETAGRPTFQVRPGATGRSRALAVAARSGLPQAVLQSARERLGSGWAAQDAALERLEREAARARQEAERAAEEATRLAARQRELERERSALGAERAQLKEKLKRDFDRALEVLRERTRREIEALGAELRQTGRALPKGALTTITQKAREDAEALLPEDAPEDRGPVAVGDTVRVAPFRSTGKLLSLDARGEAEVEVGGKRLRVPAASLSRVAPPASAPSPKKPAPSARVAGDLAEAISAAPAGAAFKKPALGGGDLRGAAGTATKTHELVVVGLRVDAALPEVERALNDALLSGAGALRVVHGHGTGRLAAAVREFLDAHPAVASHRPGDAREGGGAVTIALLDV